jgi:uncharacterized repeat protein (TIGR02543 family)
VTHAYSIVNAPSGGTARAVGSSLAVFAAPAPVVTHTVNTSPAGLAFTLDGAGYTGVQTPSWSPGSNHSVGTSSPQSAPGIRFQFKSWSDGGTMSHSVTAPASPTTYTANFNTLYQLTTAVSPAGSGTVTPGSGGFYAAGSSVGLQAKPNAGYSFAGWTGPVAGTGASTSVAMTGALSVSAKFVAGPTSLSAVVSSKSGYANARVWTVTLTNAGPGAANAAQIDNWTLTQTYGSGCTPKITVPASWPLVVGNIAPGASRSASVTINFSACSSGNRYTLRFNFSANAGAVSGSKTLLNQYR